MSDLILKIVINGVSLELQGDSTTVKTVFDDVRENGLGAMSTVANYTQLANIAKLSESTNIVVSEQAAIEINDNPSLEQIKIKDLPKTEKDWVLIYIFYASNFGNKTVTKDEIITLYDTSGRKNSTRLGNFSTNLSKLVKEDLIGVVNANTYTLKPKGKERVNEIISGSTTASGKKIQKKTQKQSSAAVGYKYIELGLSSSEITELENHFNKYKGKEKTVINKILIVYDWAIKNKGIEKIDTSTVYSLLKLSGETPTYDIPGTLKNMKNRNQYLKATDEKNVYLITPFGEKHLKEEIYK